MTCRFPCPEHRDGCDRLECRRQIAGEEVEEFVWAGPIWLTYNRSKPASTYARAAVTMASTSGPHGIAPATSSTVTFDDACSNKAGDPSSCDSSPGTALVRHRRWASSAHLTRSSPQHTLSPALASPRP